MRDALKLEKNQPIIVEGVKYKLDSFYYMRETNQVYVKCFNVKERNFLNMKIEEFVEHWKKWKV